MKTFLIALSCLVSVSVFSQNITNTLGTNGTFTIKDLTNNYFTLSQSTGQVNILRTLRLENTTSSSVGVINKGSNRFLHTFGTENTFLGVNSGNFTMTNADQNTGIGRGSLSDLTTGSWNTALGYHSLTSNTDGDYNTAVGHQSLDGNTEGDYNTALGKNSTFSNTNGAFNTAVGYRSLYSNISGYGNTALGTNSLSSSSTTSYNTAVGNLSLYFSTTGHNNTAVGFRSLYNNTTGAFNTAVGLNSLDANTTGAYNTAIGQLSGSTITSGDNVTCVGYNAQPTSATANNQITLGNNQITSLRCNVQTITSLSDSRDKRNVKDLSLGLDFLMKIKPRLFNWDKREWYNNNISDGSKMEQAPTAGFIAQELDEVQTTENAEWLKLVLKDNPEKFEATYGNLLPVMVKAIQELNEENEKLKMKNEKHEEGLAKVESLKTENDKLKSEVESLKSMNEKLVKLEKIVNELTLVKHTSLSKSIENKTISKEGDGK